MRRRRFGFGARRFSRRSLAWIPGLNTKDDSAAVGTEVRSIVQTRVVTGFQTFGAAIALVNNTDLSMHGGEDAVVTRIRGNLGFFGGQRDNGAGLAATAFLLRLVVAQTDADAAGSVMPFRFNDSATLGNDDILWMKDVFVSNAAGFVDSVNISSTTSAMRDAMHEVDVRAKRKLQSDRTLTLWLQSVVPPATVAQQFLMFGSLRILLKRPR